MLISCESLTKKGAFLVSRVTSFAFNGVETAEVDVQVKISSGLPAFNMVGLPDKAVSESRERVRAAITSLGIAFPAKRITVNLAPADLLKEGSHFDLPVAIGLLMEMGVIPAFSADKYSALGELALDGRISSVSGILPASIASIEISKGIICPFENGSEAAWAGDEIEIVAAKTLQELINHVTGRQQIPIPRKTTSSSFGRPKVDMKTIKGQDSAKRALEIAASGGHNLLMSGPPGSGKSMLASALAGILPPMTAREMLETSVIHSVSGGLGNSGILSSRPFRDPHHSASMAAMVGGGRNPKPGEISLAHNGILFLDELPEFPRAVLESLRQPLENGTVSVARVSSHVTYPANFQLIAAMNPCKCGFLGDPARECGKAPKCAMDYQAKLSGPLLDRIDIHIDVPMLGIQEIINLKEAESSEVIAERVSKARILQYERYNKIGLNVLTNSRAPAEVISEICELDLPSKELMQQAIEKRAISMRGYTRILRIARTIADMESTQNITRAHIAEAIAYKLPQY